jgi:hypothetical protein
MRTPQEYETARQIQTFACDFSVREESADRGASDNSRRHQSVVEARGRAVSLTGYGDALHRADGRCGSKALGPRISVDRFEAPEAMGRGQWSSPSDGLFRLHLERWTTGAEPRVSSPPADGTLPMEQQWAVRMKSHRRAGVP